MLNELVVTLAKVEATYGVDAAPTGADALLTTGVKLMPMIANAIPLAYDRSGFGNDQHIHVGVHVGIEFSVYLVGSGTLGTAPAWGKLVRACQCEEIIVASTSVRYKRLSTSTTSLTIDYFLDGQRHRMVGARGSWSIQMSSQGLPMLRFRFIGLWVDPSSVANPTSLTGWAAFQTPLPVTFDHTPTVLVAGYAAILKSLTIEQNAKTTYFDNPGERKVEIVDATPDGQIEIIAPPLSAKNYFTEIKANTMGALQVVHGTVNATKVIIDAPGTRMQMRQPDYGDDNGRATLKAQLAFVPTSANDDEIEIRLAAA